MIGTEKKLLQEMVGHVDDVRNDLQTILAGVAEFNEEDFREQVLEICDADFESLMRIANEYCIEQVGKVNALLVVGGTTNEALQRWQKRVTFLTAMLT